MRNYLNRMSAFFSPYQEFNNETSYHQNEYSYQQSFPQGYPRPYTELDQATSYETNRLRRDNLQHCQGSGFFPHCRANLYGTSTSSIDNEISTDVKTDMGEENDHCQKTKNFVSGQLEKVKNEENNEMVEKSVTYPWMKSQFGKIQSSKRFHMYFIARAIFN